MIRISTSAIVPDEGRRLPFYLALEEWVARCMPTDDYAFTWRVTPTVILGRNQDAANEVDLEYCRDRGVQLYRRRSGGGCVYADLGNIMVSLILPTADVELAFARYAELMVGVLRDLGLNAAVTGRNDVVVDGLKVSGAALYRLHGKSIIHGTLLYDTDFDNMAHAITPSRSKLESHMVRSVQSRITTLNRYIPHMSVDDVQAYVDRRLQDGVYTLSPDQIAQVQQIEQGYYDLHWTFGRTGILGCKQGCARISRRLEGVGSLDLLMLLAGDRISHIQLTGDFFVLDDLDAAIFNKLIGCKLDARSLADALADTDVSQAIRGLSNEAFVRILTSVHVNNINNNQKSNNKWTR